MNMVNLRKFTGSISGETGVEILQEPVSINPNNVLLVEAETNPKNKDGSKISLGKRDENGDHVLKEISVLDSPQVVNDSINASN